MQDAASSLPSGRALNEQEAPRSSLRASEGSELPRRLLADLLWDAANKYLTETHDLGALRSDPFSCNAVGMAATSGTGCLLPQPARSFLQSLGCSGSAVQLEKISGLPSGPRLQGVRYMWLLLAMHVAEDEGITL